MGVSDLSASQHVPKTSAQVRTASILVLLQCLPRELVSYSTTVHTVGWVIQLGGTCTYTYAYSWVGLPQAHSVGWDYLACRLIQLGGTTLGPTLKSVHE